MTDVLTVNFCNILSLEVATSREFSILFIPSDILVRGALIRISFDTHARAGGAGRSGVRARPRDGNNY